MGLLKGMDLQLRLWFNFQQHPPELPPPWFPDGIFGLAGECCGPILIPLALSKERIMYVYFLGGYYGKYQTNTGYEFLRLTYLIIDIEDTFLNFVVNFSCSINECFFYIGCSFRWSFHED